MRLLLATIAAAGLSGCAAYVPSYGGVETYPGYGYGTGAYPYPYGAAQAYPAPYYGGSSIYYGATIIAPPPAYGFPYRHHWADRDGHGERRHGGQHDGRRDHPGQRDGRDRPDHRDGWRWQR